MKAFLLIFLSWCGNGYWCAHEVFRYATSAECYAAQSEYAGYRTICVSMVGDDAKTFGKALKNEGQPKP